jgi:hypothetical protein
MAAGMAAATLTHTMESLGVSTKAATLTWPTNEVAQTGGLLVVVSLMVFTALAQAARSVSCSAQQRGATAAGGLTDGLHCPAQTAACSVEAACKLPAPHIMP